MSDYHRIDGARLDAWITGHYGEDQFRDDPEEDDDEDDTDLHVPDLGEAGA